MNNQSFNFGLIKKSFKKWPVANKYNKTNLQG